MVEKTGGDVLLRQGEGEERGESCFLALRGMDAPKYKLNIAASRLLLFVALFFGISVCRL